MYDCFELSLEKEEMVDIILLCDKPTTTLPINCRLYAKGTPDSYEERI
jgi:hypothetical protein